MSVASQSWRNWAHACILWHYPVPHLSKTNCMPWIDDESGALVSISAYLMALLPLPSLLLICRRTTRDLGNDTTAIYIQQANFQGSLRRGRNNTRVHNKVCSHSASEVSVITWVLLNCAFRYSCLIVIIKRDLGKVASRPSFKAVLDSEELHTSLQQRLRWSFRPY